MVLQIGKEIGWAKLATHSNSPDSDAYVEKAWAQGTFEITAMLIVEVIS